MNVNRHDFRYTGTHTHTYAYRHTCWYTHMHQDWFCSTKKSTCLHGKAGTHSWFDYAAQRTAHAYTGKAHTHSSFDDLITL